MLRSNVIASLQSDPSLAAAMMAVPMSVPVAVTSPVHPAGSERPVLILIECRVHQRTSLSGSFGSGALTPEGTRPVLREAHMTRFTKMFAAVSGAVGIGLVGVSAFLTLPASTQASMYEVAQINPDQMTRNAPRDLPSFEQNYQMHTGVLDTLRR